MQGAAPRDQGHILAWPFDVGETQRDQVLLLGYLSLEVVEHLIFHEHDRVVVTNGALQQALGVLGRCGRDHDQPGHVGVPGLERL